MAQKKQSKGTGAIAGGSALGAFGAANAPVLRAGSKDSPKMVGASPKLQPARYQAELHNAMKTGEVETDSPVRVFRTPSGRHINAGGTHRHIARQAMGKPSNYEIKDINHEMPRSPMQAVQQRRQMGKLKRGSERAEAGKKVKPVGNFSRNLNHGLAAAADVNDDRMWQNTHELADHVKAGKRAGLVGAGQLVGAGALVAGAGLKERSDWKKKQARTTKKVAKSMSTSAFGIEHGEISKADQRTSYKPSRGHASAGRLATGALLPGYHGAVAGRKGSKLKAASTEVGSTVGGSIAASVVTRGRGAGIGALAGGAGGAEISNQKGWLKRQYK